MARREQFGRRLIEFQTVGHRLVSLVAAAEFALQQWDDEAGAPAADEADPPTPRGVSG
ncbi:MAG: hypothetical protein HY241_16595 [Actinobacteria bacterium]|nr:hypothetical protein [Actinomycetota bacterium]